MPYSTRKSRISSALVQEVTTRNEPQNSSTTMLNTLFSAVAAQLYYVASPGPCLTCVFERKTNNCDLLIFANNWALDSFGRFRDEKFSKRKHMYYRSGCLFNIFWKRLSSRTSSYCVLFACIFRTVYDGDMAIVRLRGPPTLKSGPPRHLVEQALVLD